MRGTVWTEALDDHLRTLRYAGLTWDAVAQAMCLGRNTVLERARKLGARRRGPVMAPDLDDPADRPARPPGHPATWGMITNGTVLQGAPYPYPVFL